MLYRFVKERMRLKGEKKIKRMMKLTEIKKIEMTPLCIALIMKMPSYQFSFCSRTPCALLANLFELK